MSKTLLYDLETSTRLVHVWDHYDQNVIEVERESFILCVAYKWLGQKTTKVIALPDFPLYKREPHNDRELVKELWKLLNEADLVCGHNSQSFDDRWSMRQIALHNLKPPSPFRNIDTRKIARRHFRFHSNSLDDLGAFFGLGRKKEHRGKHTWLGCIRGDKKSWKEMIRYAKGDLDLLESVYLKLRPFDTTHPNVNLYDDDVEPIRCPVCRSTHIQRRGWHPTGRFSKYKRYQCQSCGKWGKGKTQRVREMEIG